MKICKHIVTKASEDKKDVYKALLAQRNTVQEGFLTSPAQRVLGRRAKTDLPTTKSLLQPNTNHLSDKRDMISRQQKVKQAYDKHTKNLQPLKEQDNARLKPVSLGDKVWAKEKVIKRLDERPYLVDNGKSLLRNRVDLRKTPDTKQSISIDNDVKDVETRSTILQSYTGSQTVHDSGSKTTHGKTSDQMEIPAPPPCDPLPSFPGPADRTEVKLVITRSGRRSVRPKFLQDYV